MKNCNDKNQIFKYANSTRLIDVVDNMMSTREKVDSKGNKKQIFNKNLLINVNVFAEKGKQVTYFMGMDEALLLSHFIINDTFKDTVFAGSTPGMFAGYGGVGTSRVLQIKYDNGKYLVQVSLYEAIKGKNGLPMPNKNKPLGNQSIQVPKMDMIRFALVVKAAVENRLAEMAKTDYIPSSDDTSSKKSNEVPKMTQKSEPEKEETDIFDEMWEMIDE